MNAFILCAGEGKRLGMRTPKPLIKVGGKPILWWIAKNLQKHDIDEICVNVHYLPLEIMDYFGILSQYSGELKLMGTAGALKKIGKYSFFWDYSERKYLGCKTNWEEANLVVVNGDTITNVNLTDMATFHKKEGNIATVFTHNTAIHNGGTFIFKKEILNYIPKNKHYSIHEDLLPDLIEKKVPISLYKSDAYYFDCGTPEKLAKARRFFGQGSSNLPKL